LALYSVRRKTGYVHKDLHKNLHENNQPWPMNAFDAVVTIAALVAVVMGFISGLLRSLAAILAYIIAAPITVAITPRLAALAFGRGSLSGPEAWIVLFVVFLGLGLLISAMLRVVVSEMAGHEISLFDRIAGAVLGAIRIFLVAVLIVIVFDRLIPADRQPSFLVGSKLRPYLSAAGRQGLQSLPPDIADYIDRVKRERGL
jgi:membrane protein required for colicin V production